MAAGQIRMTPDTMRRRADEYHREGEELGQSISRMDKLLQTLQGEWEGAAMDEYATRWVSLKKSIQSAQTLIYEIEAALDKTAEIVEQTDKDIASQFRG